MTISTVPRPKKAKPDAYGEGVMKKPYQFMLTEEASEMIDQIADELGLTRSETLERAIRAGAIKLASEYQSEIVAEGDA
ncbi:hypothetical protein [Coleofasciculus sp. FACHB-542]|uniref:hypothetical protein n=1 Tax=Coleofasciculus sp. FACHB-542 TaxID=2692787 RepID=UPI001686DEF8|nr:hypothetical protein [Coleofasciculus sp. FACHB-542]MBD2087883.1 hypothetical protein [Coleofasciculus sp. FACHB-542]